MGTPLMAIRKDKIGINNPSPQYALDVVGDINVTGSVYKNGKEIGSADDTGWIEPESHWAYRVIGGNHVYVSIDLEMSLWITSGGLGNATYTINDSKIPEQYRPKRNEYAFVPASESTYKTQIAKFVIGTDGDIKLDGIFSFSGYSGANGQTLIPVQIEGCISYFID